MRADIVVVGGGAGGLELACKLGRKLGRSKVMLVDSRLYHIWKPSLHEVAAGTLDIHQEGLSYQMLAHDNGFTFVYGALVGLDATAKRLRVGSVGSAGQDDVLPERSIDFAKLVIAVGSSANYFGVPGAIEHTISLNATEDAERFRQKLLRLLAIADQEKGAGGDAAVDIVIIGGGATGVELAAELREASAVYASYGFEHLEALRDVHITLLEGAARILAPLPERVAHAALALLQQRDIRVVTGCTVSAIGRGQVRDAAGHAYRADLCVWAAGIRAPEWLATLGLPTNRAGQLVVDDWMQVKGFSDIYALGDCAACLDSAGKPVPPRAQAAHQQADFLRQTFLRQAAGKAPQARGYRYTDYGALVSIGSNTSVGSLMGALRGLNWFVEGFFARMMYLSLHLLHHAAVLGPVRTGLLAVARFLIRRTTPLVKLH
ncbi:MAG: NAD(P)/FAD-dependent oxidoreductase [Massilia sp.]|nr:NAD(P)/FAD-dependent oxidoreductase [Massilia sp.]